MDNPQDMNPGNSSNSMAVDENKQLSCSLTQNVDKITESEIKKVEVQKIEGDLTIKMLKVEYSEKKRNFMYAKKKLEEVQARLSMQSETVNQLLHANKKIVETFSELKKFQNETILMDVSNAEKTFVNSKNKNAELLNMHQMIFENDNYSKRLNKEILDKRNELDKDVKTQIEQEKGVCNNQNKLLIQLKINIENLKTELNQEKVDDRVINLIEEKNKRIIQLEADQELFQRECKEEIDDLTQKKTDKFQDLKNENKMLGEKKALISKLQSELLFIEESIKKENVNLAKIEVEKEECSKEVMKKRQINELAETALEETVKNINSEQEKVNVELEKTKNKFSLNESNMQDELKKLHSIVEEKKKFVKTLEMYQNNLIKLKNSKSQKEKDLSIDKDLQDTFSKSAGELKQDEQLLSITNRTQKELEVKIKELQEQRNSLKGKIETVNKEQENELDIRVKHLQERICKRNNIKQKLELSNKDQENLNASDNIDSRTSHSYKQATQTKNLQTKSINLTDEFEYNKAEEMNIKTSEKASKSINSDKKSIYSFNLDDSDESEDEYKISNIPPKKITGLTTTPQKKSIYNLEMNEEVPRETTLRLSQSELLFDEMMSQKPPESPKSSKNTDVFKVPHPYVTPIRKKSNQTKKY